MPVYEYKCQVCGVVFEARQKFSDDPLTECCECGSGPVEKLISLGGFALKGNGWYHQGYGGAEKPTACASAGSSEGCAGCPKAANE